MDYPPKNPLSKSAIRNMKKNKKKNRKKAAETEEKLGNSSIQQTTETDEKLGNPSSIQQPTETGEKLEYPRKQATETDGKSGNSSSIQQTTETDGELGNPSSIQQSTRVNKPLSSKSLYIFTTQLDASRSCWLVVHGIKMEDVLSASESEIPSLRLYTVAFRSGDNTDIAMLSAGCGVFKSRIIIGGGLEMTEEFTWSLSKRLFYLECDFIQRDFKPFPSFSEGKHCPVLLEIKGTLYAIDSGNKCKGPHFERFDERSGTWKPMPPAPFCDPKSPYYNIGPRGITTVITDTSILIRRQYTPVFRFDCTKPGAGWCVTNFKSTPFHGETLVQACRGGFVIFAMDMDNGYMDRLPTRFPRIRVYFMCCDYVSLSLLGTIELPCTDKLPVIFREPLPPLYSFLDLGDQTVGLVLATNDLSGDDKRMKFLVTTFQYRLIPGFSYEWLNNPVTLEYDLWQYTPSPATWCGSMPGAFVL